MAASTVSPKSNHSEEPLTLTQKDGAGYFPGQPGTVLNGRYKIVAKLGWGESSSTWLVEDKRLKEHFALKILTVHATQAHGPGGSNELGILKAVARPATVMYNAPIKSPAGKNVLKLIDNFEATSAHGKHLCFVTNALSLSLDGYRRLCPAKRFKLRTIKEVVASMRITLDYLHKLNIVHNDINGEKILFDLYTTDDLADLLGEFTPQAVTTTTIDGKEVQVWSSQPLDWDCKWDDDGVALEYDKFCLIGFGSAHWSSPHPTDIHFIHKPYIAPELLLGGPITHKSDTWSLGCLVYNLLTGEDLFTITADTDSVSIIGHLAQMVAYSGNAFSEGFLKSCKRHEEYFAASGDLLSCPKLESETIKQKLSSMKIPGLDEEDVDDAASLITACLQLDPKLRPSADSLLNFPFLKLRTSY